MAEAGSRPIPAIDIDMAALAALCRRFDVRSLDLFGSAVNGRFDPAQSDLDFLVAFERTPFGMSLKAYFGFQEELEKMFGRSVDLVSEANLENPFFRRRVEAKRQRMFPPP